MNEWSGIGNYLDFGARGYDSRTARLGYSIDPLFKKFAWQSPYVFAANSPILHIDDEGRVKTVYTIIINQKTGHNSVGMTTQSGLLSQAGRYANSGLFADKDDYHNTKDWYDYSVTNITVIGKDGKSHSLAPRVKRGRFRTSTEPFLGEAWAMFKTGDIVANKAKQSGTFDGFYEYSKDANGSDSKYNPKGGPGTQTLDAGLILEVLSRLNILTGETPKNIIDAIKYLKDGVELSHDLSENLPSSEHSEGNDGKTLKWIQDKKGVQLERDKQWGYRNSSTCHKR